MTRQGWICPRCGKVWAPWVSNCDCKVGTGVSVGVGKQVTVGAVKLEGVVDANITITDNHAWARKFRPRHLPLVLCSFCGLSSPYDPISSLVRCGVCGANMDAAARSQGVR